MCYPNFQRSELTKELRASVRGGLFKGQWYNTDTLYTQQSGPACRGESCLDMSALQLLQESATEKRLKLDSGHTSQFCRPARGEA